MSLKEQFERDALRSWFCDKYYSKARDEVYEELKGEFGWRGVFKDTTHRIAAKINDWFQEELKKESCIK